MVGGGQGQGGSQGPIFLEGAGAMAGGFPMSNIFFGGGPIFSRRPGPGPRPGLGGTGPPPPDFFFFLKNKIWGGGQKNVKKSLAPKVWHHKSGTTSPVPQVQHHKSGTTSPAPQVRHHKSDMRASSCHAWAVRHLRSRRRTVLYGDVFMMIPFVLYLYCYWEAKTRSVNLSKHHGQYNVDWSGNF